MKLLKTALCAAVASMAMAGAAQAQDVAFNVGVATDYIFRGIDQTADRDGQIFGGVDVTQDQFYGGVWLSNTGPDGDGAVEYDLYAGFKPSVGGVSLDLGVIYYGYTDSDSGAVSSDLNALEVKVAGSVPVGPVTLGAAVYYSPENGGFLDESTLYYEANVAWTYGEGGPTVSGAIGNFSADIPALVPDSYTTWNLGATFPLSERISLDARYHDTDSDAETLFGGLAGESFVASLKFAF